MVFFVGDGWELKEYPGADPVGDLGMTLSLDNGYDCGKIRSIRKKE